MGGRNIRTTPVEDITRMIAEKVSYSHFRCVPEHEVLEGAVGPEKHFNGTQLPTNIEVELKIRVVNKTAQNEEVNLHALVLCTPMIMLNRACRRL